MTTTTATTSLGLLPMLKRGLASSVAVAIVLSGMPRASMAALTDLSSNPIAANAAVQAKPNIMLLMDSSGSMAWTHMPDEVEKVGNTDYTGSVGYRATQCNSIYYNPLLDYTLPKLPDGSSFPQPSFTNAPYGGFSSYYLAPDATDLSSVDLSSSFKAFDTKTLRATGISDTAQPAYYYTYSGPQTLTYDSPACRQADTGATNYSVVGGGVWYRVQVSATSGRPGNADERNNFAVWYSYYRTRLSLIKTAASLAFSPLTDSFRIGLITVEPKTNPTDTTINQAKYTAIADFDAPQRTAWFSKLFSQPAEGASPAREGLARVGRHFAGKQDGINAGMTGDPVQYSCQQNFTIMTTDGYWNSQTETPGAGPVKIDGTTRVGQQDHILTASSGLSPRPIWEGFATDTVVTTDNVNNFHYSPCGSYLFERTTQRSSSTTQLTYTSSQLVTRTVQTTQSTHQASQTTSRTDETTTQHTQSTSQSLQTDNQVRQTTAQITQATSQLQQVNTQVQQRQDRLDQSTSQVQQRSFQTRQQTSRTDENTLQTRIATARVDASTTQTTQTTTQTTSRTSQVSQSTTQNSRSTSQTRRSTVQLTERTSQSRTCDSRTELCTPVPTGTCRASGYYYCETAETGPTLVANCTPATANSGNNYTTTTCSSSNTGPTPVASCTPAPANSGNSFVATNCDTVTTGPTAVVTCTPQSANGGNSYTDTTCGTVTSPATPVASCTTETANAGNSYTATSCSTLSSTAVGVSSCTADPATSGNSYTETICGSNNTGPTGVSSCTMSSPTSGNSYTTTTCGSSNTAPTPVSSCTNSGANSGNSWVATTCTPVTTGPTPIASCSPSGATAMNSWTTTTCPNVTGTATPVQTCTPAAGNSGNNYTATTCTPVVTGPVGVASCTPSSANGGNSWTDTTCTTNNTAWTPVASCTPQSPNGGNGYTTVECQTVPTGPTPVASCTPATANSGNTYTNTTCNAVSIQPWTNVGSCVPDAAGPGNGYVVTSCRTQSSAPVGVAACTPSAPNGSGQGVNCSTVITPYTGVASCTPQVAGPGNNYVDIFCGTNNTGPALVTSCTASGPTTGNGYTTTTCSPTSVGPTAVASCTPAVAGPGNGYTETVCTPVNTGPTPMQTCTPVSPFSGNGYTTTSCADVISGPAPVQTCTPAAASAGNSWTEHTCAPVNTGPTLVASCANQAPSGGNNWTTLTCSSVDTGPTPVSSCTNSGPDVGNNFVATSCVVTTSPDLGVGSCSPVLANSGNNWTETQCATITSGGGTNACTAQVASSGNSWIDITCATANTGPTLSASCTPTIGNSGNGWTTTTCSEVITGPTLNPSCTAALPNGGNNFVETTCTNVSGSEVVYNTTQTVSTQQYSGSTPIGSPTVSTSTSADTTYGACKPPGFLDPLPTPNPQRAGILAGPYPPSSCTSGWPCTMTTANSGGSVDSLADVAQYYYATDLRSTMIDNVPSVGTGPEDDRVNWQHMTTFTVGLGVSGTLEYRSDYKSSGATTGAFAEIRSGARNWPIWPDPNLNYDGSSGGNYGLWNNPKSIDDFWHTAVNGRGTYFNAKRPDTLITGLADALADVGVRTGSGSGVTVSNPEPKVGDNFAFTTLYTTERWTGDVLGYNIDVLTGALSSTPNWSAQTKLDTKTSGACDSRNIYLFRAGATDNKVNFSWNTFACDGLGNPSGPPDTGLNATEQAFFGPASASNLGQYLAMTDGTGGTVNQRAAAPGSSLVNFLRGQRGREGFVPNDLGKLYRSREHVLGDVVNGQAAYVKGPLASFQDAGYDAYKTANATRTPMLYVPANDGMLHAFYAGTNAADPQGGQEAWAFMPTTVLPNLYKLADTYYKNRHEFFVDGTPVAADAYDGSAWKTIVVAGLSGGGKGYYALDVTDPSSPKALWEFKNSSTCYNGTAATAGSDCHIGYTYGKPVVTKLADGSWVALVTSGYNNVNAPPIAGDGVGYLYVLDAFTGQIRFKISTGVGDATTPSGLAHINAFVDYAAFNNTARQVYGGDMLGNLWRFDLNDTIAPAGREAALLGVAKDPGGIPQPITTRPELAELSGKPMVFIGTGRLLGASDFGDSQVQSVYGIVDTLGPGTVYPGSLRTTFKPLAFSSINSGADRTVMCTGSTAQCGSTSGWVIDLPDGGERVNVEMKLARGTLVFASNVPSNAPCTTGGYSWLNQLSFASGLPVSTSGGVASLSQFDSLATAVNVILVNGGLQGIRRFSDGRNRNDPVSFDTPPPSGKRISWREIAQ